MDTMIVTGGAGFIGSNFVRLATQATRCHIVVLDKLTYAGSLLNLRELPADRITFVQADIADGAAVRGIVRRYEPRWVVNFAAESHVDRSIDGPRAFVETNIVGTFELLEACREHLSRCTDSKRARFRFLHVSTDEVYGTLGATGLFSETTPYAPNSPYAATKASADHLVRAYYETFDVPTVITNCSNNYGPFQFPEKLIPLTILNALEGRPLPIYGDGRQVRDWLFVEDHCAAILLVLEQGAAGGKYNIGASNEQTNVAVVDLICRILDGVVPVGRNAAVARKIASYAELKTFVPDRPGHDRRYAIDASRVSAELGWRPRHEFERGMDLTVRWYVENRDWCDAVQAGGYGRERLGLASPVDGQA